MKAGEGQAPPGQQRWTLGLAWAWAQGGQVVAVVVGVVVSDDPLGCGCYC